MPKGSIPSPQRVGADRPGMKPVTYILLGLLLVCPAVALSRLAAHAPVWLLIGAPAVVSLVTAAAYRSDKRRAGEGSWRISETTLHLLSLAGGWPGAFVAQRVWRHKTAKASFQLVFLVTVVAYQFAAIDVLSNGEIRRLLWAALRKHAGA